MANQAPQASSAIRASVLTQEDYLPYGEVIAPREDLKPGKANLGTADRYDFLARLENRRPGQAEANLCVFRCEPMIRPGETSFDVKLLERHAHSTQAFVPMPGAERYLVIVCLGGDRPDLSTLRAFVAAASQGVTYRPGVWHHPLAVMDRGATFACLVWEDGSSGDCDVADLAAPVRVEL